jgi:hypothetical protein
MSSLKHRADLHPDFSAPLSEALRNALAAVLRGASVALARLARRLARTVPPRRIADPRFEFHAEAGAPEGALYVDGKLFGWVPGVTRL